MPRSAFLLLSLVAGAAAAAPRVAVVVVSHQGLTDEQADELAYDLAGSIATQIEGEAIAGPSVRELLPDGVRAGCEDDPICGRKLGKKLKTDEVLFLVMTKAAKKDVSIVAHRIARDPDRVPTDATLALGGGKAKRGKAITTMVTTLYPTGSVRPYAESAPPPPPPPPVADRQTTTWEVNPGDTPGDAEEQPEPAVRRRHARRDGATTPVYKKAWFWAVVAGGMVVLGGAIAGIAIAAQPGPTAAPVELPP